PLLRAGVRMASSEERGLAGGTGGIVIRMKALLLENIHSGAVRVFKEAGFKVEAIPNTIRVRLVY
ncbi:MAG: hypothetical protein WBA34_09640, partial [Candidatus Deferrimicrobiaceae bacterium]